MYILEEIPRNVLLWLCVSVRILISRLSEDNLFELFFRGDINRICTTIIGVMTTKAFIFCTLISQLFLVLVLARKSKYVSHSESKVTCL